MKADVSTTAAVLTALDAAHAAYARRDAAALLSHFAPDDDVLMIGTGADEKRLGQPEIQAQAERDWSQTDASSIRLENTQVSAAGPVAWVAADATFDVQIGGQSLELPGRLTAVLEARGSRWLVVQAHYSLPWAEQAAGESFPAESAAQPVA